jgi:hypothetical protein
LILFEPKSLLRLGTRLSSGLALLLLLGACSAPRPRPSLPPELKIGMTIAEVAEKRPGRYVGAFALRSFPKLSRSELEKGGYTGTIVILDFPVFDEDFTVRCSNGRVMEAQNHAGYRSKSDSVLLQGADAEKIRSAKTVAELLKLLPAETDLRRANEDADLFSVDLPKQLSRLNNFSGDLGNLENFDQYNRETNMWFYKGKLVYLQSAVEESKLMD